LSTEEVMLSGGEALDIFKLALASIDIYGSLRRIH
jgi:hypothetical protein